MYLAPPFRGHTDNSVVVVGHHATRTDLGSNPAPLVSVARLDRYSFYLISLSHSLSLSFRARKRHFVVCTRSMFWVVVFLFTPLSPLPTLFQRDIKSRSRKIKDDISYTFWYSAWRSARLVKGEVWGRGREASGDAQNLNLLHFSAGAAGDRTLVCVRGLHQKRFVGEAIGGRNRVKLRIQNDFEQKNFWMLHDK